MRTRAKRRHVLADGYVGEWNLQEGARYYRAIAGTIYMNVFARARDIAGSRRRKGLRAVRVRVVLEEL